MKTYLCELMTKYGSDKGQGPHNYTVFYHKLFENKRIESLKIFELGLGTNNLDVVSNMGVHGKPGASLRGWKEYFPNSEVYGADIDKRILFKEDRIETFYCDQKNIVEIKNMWNNSSLKDKLFDIIIEDGLHEFEANLIFLENSIHKISKEGIYICEDLRMETVELFKREIPNLKNKFVNFDFEILILENPNNRYNDNNLLVVKRLS